ncbi:hypothetical protein N8T08_008800 [Aspergillus melleus]|uniref:Uncharacterized protein n=1 Tax=Aspergillus melleus TaxID=138277 RepID=A0ACC3AW80_9EURO|nr:hypothetical protein N8T08_008800 [Aspergillus melleus]
MAFYVPEIFDMSGMYRNKVGWHRLEVVLDAYLQTIDEGKINTVAPLGVEQTVRDDHDDAYESKLPEPDVMKPWYIHTFTEKDLGRAITAFNRLIDAIERRLPRMQTQNKSNYTFPWPDSIVLKPIGNFSRPCFAYEFLKSITKRPVKFQCIAPGINLPEASDISEYLSPREDKNFLQWRSSMEPYEIPVLLFPVKGEDLVRWSHDSSGKVRAGLYLTEAVPGDEIPFGDACILALPFGIGAKGWARQSNGVPLALDLDTRYDKPKDSHVDLYQSYGNGFNALHCVQLYKVLDNWAHRVEDGDWDVGENGVLGGPEKFREADTEEHWQKYWIPPSW